MRPIVARGSDRSGPPTCRPKRLGLGQSGVARSPEVRAERLRRLDVLASTFEPLPVDDGVARSYGRLAAAVVAAGRQPRARVMDLLIASTAHTLGAVLYTRNADDFRGLEGDVEIVAV